MTTNLIDDRGPVVIADSGSVKQQNHVMIDLDVLLDPRRWTREMNDAWHQAIPDLQAAFDALRRAYVD